MRQMVLIYAVGGERVQVGKVKMETWGKSPKHEDRENKWDLFIRSYYLEYFWVSNDKEGLMSVY